MATMGANGLTRRRIVALVMLLVALTVAGALAYRHSIQPRTSVDRDGRYRLLSSDGTLFDRASLRGHPYLAYFGYTHCPDICPAMLAQLVEARKRLGLSDRDLRIVFISIDPERDTPSRLAQFIALLDGPVIALTGDPGVISAVADSAAVYVKRVPSGDGSYAIEHTTSVFVYDRNGDFFDTIQPDAGREAILAKIRGVMADPLPAKPAHAAT